MPENHSYPGTHSSHVCFAGEVCTLCKDELQIPQCKPELQIRSSLELRD